jgi:hypothetical protein
LPQVPQLFRSRWRFVQTPPQYARSACAQTQAPARQLDPRVQVYPHVPQLVFEVCVSTHKPPHD